MGGLISSKPAWIGRAAHAYGHLLEVELDPGYYHFDSLQVSHPQVVPHAFRCENMLQVLSWVSFKLTEDATLLLDRLRTRAGNGDLQLHKPPAAD